MAAVAKILAEYYPALLSGIWVTAKLCLMTWVIGLPAGIGLGLASARWPRVVGLPVRGAAFLLSATPALILLYWVYYPAPKLTGIELSAYVTSVLVFSMYMTSAVAEHLRGALIDFPRQFVVAGIVSGLTTTEIVWNIQAPLLGRQLLPAILGSMLTTLHLSLFASLITVDEIFRVAQRVNAQEYQPVAVYSTVAVLFLVICVPLHASAVWLRRRYARDWSER